MAKKNGDAFVNATVHDFIDLSLEQHEALLDLDTQRYNRAFDRIASLAEELKAAPGDQRHALTRLFEHSNAQVRLNAATYAHPLYPEQSINVVQSIVEDKTLPQSIYAKDVLDYLRSGPLVPR